MKISMIEYPIRYTLPALLLLLLALPLHAQDWLWVQSEGALMTDPSVGHDPAENTYASGLYSGTTSFGGRTLVSRGSRDIALAKYGVDGTPQWGISIGGKEDDQSHAIEVDAMGNTVIVGEFRDSCFFGDSLRVSRGGSDLFIARYNTDGDLVWLVTGGGVGGDLASALVIDQIGDIYVTGAFSGTLTIADSTVTSFGVSDMFVLRLNASGRLLFFRHVGAAGSSAEGLGIARRANGDTYIGGSFTSRLEFSATTLTNPGGATDGFVVRYNGFGLPLWARQFGGSVSGRVVSVASFGRTLLATGDFTGSLSVDTFAIASRGASDIFVALIDTSGRPTAVNTVGGTGPDIATAIRFLIPTKAFVSGTFSGSASFGDTTLQSAGATDIFVMAVDVSNGKTIWATRAGGSGEDATGAMDVHAPVAYISGTFSDAASFGDLTRTGGKQNFFAARFSEKRTLTISAPGGSLCSGELFTIGLATAGYFSGANVFRAELSDSLGNFASPIVIGSSTNSSATSIDTRVPMETPSGGRYRVRIVSSDPAIISSDNGADIEIRQSPVPTITASGPITFCSGGRVTLTAPVGYPSYQWSTFDTSRSITVNYGGDFWVVVRGVNGCRGISPTITVTELLPPIEPTIIRSGGDTLTASAGLGAYQWYLDGVLIDGATKLWLVAPQSGNYTVTITDINGCSSTSKPFALADVALEFIGDLSVDISEVSNDGIALELRTDRATRLRLRLVSTLGREVLARDASLSGGSNRLLIDLQGIAPGLYFLVTEVGGRRSIHRLVR